MNKKLDSDFLNKIKNRKIWCAASTHPTEEILCAKSHLKIKESYNNILTIIIPRHINRVKTIYEELSKLDLKIKVLNKIKYPTTHEDVEKNFIGLHHEAGSINPWEAGAQIFNFVKCPNEDCESHRPHWPWADRHHWRGQPHHPEDIFEEGIEGKRISFKIEPGDTTLNFPEVNEVGHGPLKCSSCTTQVCKNCGLEWDTTTNAHRKGEDEIEDTGGGA